MGFPISNIRTTSPATWLCPQFSLYRKVLTCSLRDTCSLQGRKMAVIPSSLLSLGLSATVGQSRESPGKSCQFIRKKDNGGRLPGRQPGTWGQFGGHSRVRHPILLYESVTFMARKSIVFSQSDGLNRYKRHSQGNCKNHPSETGHLTVTGASEDHAYSMQTCSLDNFSP